VPWNLFHVEVGGGNGGGGGGEGGGGGGDRDGGGEYTGEVIGEDATGEEEGGPPIEGGDASAKKGIANVAEMLDLNVGLPLMTRLPLTERLHVPRPYPQQRPSFAESSSVNV
jgi:hypothetical protein